MYTCELTSRTLMPSVSRACSPWVVLAWVILWNCGMAFAASSTLGAPDFEASPAHPFGWRGDGSGRFPDATPPLQRTADNLKWSTKVGSSYSSPCLSGKSVFVASEPNLLICVDAADGRERWRAATTPADLTDEPSRAKAAAYELPKDGAGMTAATPVTDGRNVYAVFSNGIVRAFDIEGKPRWITFIDAEQITGYGRSASPILVDGKLIVHITGLYGLDPETGKRLWVNADAKSAYGSPTSMKIGSTSVIVTPEGDVVRADDGKTLKSGIGLTSNASPVAVNNIVYFVERQVAAVQLDDASKNTELWTADIRRQIFGSPVIHDGLLFNVTGQAELFVFQAAAKGEQEPVVDARGLIEDNGENGTLAFASLTLAGKHLFLNTLKGELLILEATREAKPAGKIKLSSGASSSPVFAGKHLFVRDGDMLLCIGK